MANSPQIRYTLALPHCANLVLINLGNIMTTKSKTDWRVIIAAVLAFLSLVGLINSLHNVTHQDELIRIDANSVAIEKAQKIRFDIYDHISALEIAVAKLEARAGKC